MKTFAVIVKWMARIAGLGMAGFVLMFVLAHFTGSLDALKSLKTSEIIMMIFMSVSWLGLVVGLKREATGGALAVVGMVLFYCANYILAGKFPSGPWFFIFFTGPGILYLLSWFAQLKVE